MEIKHETNEQKGAFYIELDTQRVAEMSYVWAGQEKIIIDHTRVDEVLKGKGAGKLLLGELVNFARAKHLKVLPLCPFAKSVFEKVKEWTDVL